MYTILGIIMIYTTIHFFIIQDKKNCTERTAYEKIVTVVAIVSITVTYLSVMFG